MTDEHTPQQVNKIVLITWTILLLSISGYFGYVNINTGLQNKLAAIARHEARIDPNKTESGKTEPELTPPPGHENDIPSDVKIGIYVDRIVSLSIRDTSWTVDFYIWFRWSDPRFDPGETFQAVDGEIISRKLLERKETGSEFYSLYRAKAVFTKFFDPSRFPVDDHLLTINIEDSKWQSYQLRYVVDEENCQVSSRVKVPGYKIDDAKFVVKPHSYQSSRGDPDLPTGFKATYSQFICGLWIKRPDFEYYIKMFLPLFAAVTISLLGFLRKLNDRTNLQVGAFFASTAAVYVISRLLPDSNISTLTDRVINLGILTVALGIGASTLSAYFANRGEEATSQWIDRITFFILLPAYIIINILIPYFAKL